MTESGKLSLDIRRVSRSATNILLTAAMALALNACAARRPQTTPHSFVDRSYVDLQPGWRIRVVTPILKSGGFKVRMEQVKSSDGALELKTGDDFIGYEVSYYAVSARESGGLAIRFVSAETRVKGGKPSRKSQPAFLLFDFSDTARYVRLVFLTRVSHNEHDEAILGALSPAALDLLTQKLESSTAETCKAPAEGVCSWVPEGIGVQIERKNGKNWIPAI